MAEKCAISKTIYTMKAGWYSQFAFAGGSLTVAIGASNTANTSWRRLFMRHIRDRYLPVYHFQTAEVMAAIGALRSPGMVFMLQRLVFPHSPVIVFVEECYNDTTVPDKDLVRKSVEGIIRQIRCDQRHADIVLLGAGCRPGTGDGKDGLVDHSLHRAIADHYGVPFVDLQEHVMKTLQARGQKWEDIAFDNCHLNDYGQQIWYECIRDWFDKQASLYEAEPGKHEPVELPPPLYSDEFQYTRLINATKQNPKLELHGSWSKDGGEAVPWYFENVLIGHPGDTLKFAFTGTAVGLFCLTYNNGLKIETVVDGRAVPGPFTNYVVEYGTYHPLAHGMDYGEHVAQMTVGKPLKTKNRLEEPTARIAYLAVATGRPD
jgi:hypothetical protein